MKPDETNPKEVKIRAAAYVRMSTDHQKYSTENQRDAIREYAARREMKIVETYSDEGRSGLNIQGRAALARMIEDVERGRANFKCILVYDISRWGRFQDADESAHYEFICRRAGVAVYYCAEQFENDGSLPSTVFKGMKRVMAGVAARFPRGKGGKPLTTDTELLFLWLILDLLKPGGRAAVIVPDGVLFGSTNAHHKLRRDLLWEHTLEAVVSLPGGVFLPYAGVKTSILVFQKAFDPVLNDPKKPGDDPRTREVWFYEVADEAFTLDQKRKARLTGPNDLWDALVKFRTRDTSSRYFQPRYEKQRWRQVDDDFVRIAEFRAGNRPDWPIGYKLIGSPLGEPTDPDARSFLLALHGLSLTVTRQPLERRRLVIPLGPRGDAAPLGPMLERLGVTDPFARELAARADAAKTGADAVCRLFSPDGDLWPLFERLRAWREMGWLEEATLTILRTNQLPNAASNLDDSVLCLEDFSDGEQMLLARMGLLFLLRDQTNTLLLLDEPETHFNDVWKREIVDVVNHELLGDAERPGTHCQVVVSTHSSIALTDAFSPEVSQLKPEDGETRVVSPQSPIFGAEAGEIMLNVFRAEDSIGEGAMKFLDAQLDHDWQPADTERLRTLLANLGSSFHRAELRAVLKRLDAARP